MTKDFDFLEAPVTLQSQYSDSPTIKRLVESFENGFLYEDIELFYSKIFDIYSAEGIGLDIWGRILGVGRLLEVENYINDFFGFDESLLQPFDLAPFEYPSATNTYRMEDEAYRKYLLLTKAFANISSAEAPNLNYILSILYENKPCYVINVGVMQIRYVFLFALTPLDESIFKLGLLTRGAGVGYEYYSIIPEETFGFVGSGLQPFDQGMFHPEPVLVE